MDYKGLLLHQPTVDIIEFTGQNQNISESSMRIHPIELLHIHVTKICECTPHVLKTLCPETFARTRLPRPPSSGYAFQYP